MPHAITTATAMGTISVQNSGSSPKAAPARARKLVAEVSPPPLIGGEAYAVVSEVADGTRTRDHRDHNPGLYQLSYRHRAERG